MKKTVIKGIIFGMTSILTMFITGFFVVKALTVLNNVEKGDTLTASTINTIISHLVPSGAIIPFNQETCPDGWIPADGASGTVDLRGEFIRGWDNGRGVDSGRVLGSSQGDVFQDHFHGASENRLLATYNNDNRSPNSFSNGGMRLAVFRNDLEAPYNSGRTGNKTRPRNVHYYIASNNNCFSYN